MTNYLVIAVMALTASLGTPADRLNPNIGRPKRALYKSILDAREWKNPYIVTQDDGVDVLANSIAGRTHVSVEELKPFLISLPVSAWPYGRVVAQQDAGIGPASAQKEAETKRRVAVILKGLRLTVQWWPS